MKHIIGFIFLTGIIFTSCRQLNPQVMFKTPKNFSFQTDTASVRNDDFLLASRDRIEMKFFTIDGFKLVDVTQTVVGTNEAGIAYIVEEDGKIKFPILGKVQVAGMTLRQAEVMLEEMYAKYYINPFILLKVINRHAYVFYGDNGRGQMIQLQNENTTLFEALALAGGLSKDSKAWRIKVIRGNLKNPTVRLIDLSSIDGIKTSDLTIQSNDIIYIEATPDYKDKVLAQLTPIVGIVTSILLIFTLVNR